MVDLTLSLRIENLLVQVAPSYKGMRDLIERKPYETIMEVLKLNLPIGANYFADSHWQMGNHSLFELKESGYDTEQIAQDLKKIIDKGE